MSAALPALVLAVAPTGGVSRGLVLAAVGAAACLGSILLGRPLVGLGWQQATGDRTWREPGPRRRLIVVATATWALAFAVGTAGSVGLLLADTPRHEQGFAGVFAWGASVPLYVVAAAVTAWALLRVRALTPPS